MGCVNRLGAPYGPSAVDMASEDCPLGVLPLFDRLIGDHLVSCRQRFPFIESPGGAPSDQEPVRRSIQETVTKCTDLEALAVLSVGVRHAAYFT